jgi:endoglucanase
LPLGKCINLGSMLDKPVEGSHGQRSLTADDLRKIAAAGFHTVRLPVNFSAHTARTPPYRVNPAIIARVRQVLEQAQGVGLNVIVDLHRYEETNADPFGELPRLVAIWRQVAKALADQPDSVWFELLNEPKHAITPDNFRKIVDPTLAAIRESNPRRIVVIGGPPSSRVTHMDQFEMPDDPYVVQTFHNYDPVGFTHQGVKSMNPMPPIGRRFGSAADIARLNRNVQAAKDYMAKTGRVPFMGEFGVMGLDAIPDSERVSYLRTVSSAYAAAGIQSCVWNYANSYNLNLDDGSWRPGVVEALVTTRN